MRQRWGNMKETWLINFSLCYLVLICIMHTVEFDYAAVHPHKESAARSGKHQTATETFYPTQTPFTETILETTH